MTAFWSAVSLPCLCSPSPLSLPPLSLSPPAAENWPSTRQTQATTPSAAIRRNIDMSKYLHRKQVAVTGVYPAAAGDLRAGSCPGGRTGLLLPFGERGRVSAPKVVRRAGLRQRP